MILNYKNVIFYFLMIGPGTACADDFSLHPSPMNASGNAGVMPYKVPIDTEVCKLYLDNLQYFARRDIPMSCERPVAPHLLDRIKEVEWEDLDPPDYPDLFRALNGEFRGQHAASVKNRGKQGEQVQADNELSKEPSKTFAFRRAKVPLNGYPDFPGGRKSHRRQPLWLVQFGPRVFDPENPNPNYRCRPIRGGPRPSSETVLKLYLVSNDMKTLFGRVFDLENGGSGEAIRLINGRPYIETANSKGNIVIMEINLDYPRQLEPVCLYVYKHTD